MSDYSTHIIDLLKEVESFRDARNWQGYHTPANLAASISIEAAELLEEFQWRADDKLSVDALALVADELADVLIYCLSMALACGFDVSTIVRAKMAKNGIKYPAPNG